MDPIYELNTLLKKTDINVLQFEIIKDERNKKFKARLKNRIDIETGFECDSDWKSTEPEAKIDCASKAFIKIKQHPKFEENLAQSQTPIIEKSKVIYSSLLLNLVILLYYVPLSKYVFLLLLLMILIVPYIKNRNSSILVCKSNAVVVRYDKNYDHFKLPINYVNMDDYLIDITLKNPGFESQLVNDQNYIAIAKENIYLRLVENESTTVDDEREYRIVPGLDFRVLKYFSEVGLDAFETSLTIINENGKRLVYVNRNIPTSSFVRSDLSIKKVISKYGTHYIPFSFTKDSYAKGFDHYKIIVSIYFSYYYSLLFNNKVILL